MSEGNARSTLEFARPATWSGKADDLVGTTVRGKYEIHALIAVGGMGAVYRAVQRPLGRTVALKVLDLSRQKPEVALEFQKRFFREAATCATLESPHTVTLHDYGPMDDGRTMFMVLEFVRGRTLRDLLAVEKRLPVDRALDIVWQIAKSLREAHRIGVVHRDLKPSNVMITRDGEGGDLVKVLDFGLAKLMEPETSGSISLAEEFRKAVDRQEQSLSVHGVVIGSPGYMAPEQIQGEALNRATDIYALGCVLFECLAGRPPFSGRNAIDTLMRHLSEPVPTVFERNPEAVVPEEVEDLLKRCLAKEPADRFGDVRTLMAALHAITPMPAADAELAAQSAEPRAMQVSASVNRPAAPEGVAPGRAAAAMAAVALVAGVMGFVAGSWAGPPTLHVHSEPAGAEVFEGEHLLGHTPLALPGTEAPRQLELRHGQARHTVQIPAQETEHTVSVRLTP